MARLARTLSLGVAVVVMTMVPAIAHAQAHLQLIGGVTSAGEPMGNLGAGIRIESGNFHVEGGYRYVVIFTDFKSFNLNSNVVTHVNSAYAALGVKF